MVIKNVDTYTVVRMIRQRLTRILRMQSELATAIMACMVRGEMFEFRSTQIVTPNMKTEKPSIT